MTVSPWSDPEHDVAADLRSLAEASRAAFYGTTPNLPAVVDDGRFTTPRVVASGRECWWRLGPNIRNPRRNARDRGVAAFRDVGGGRCVIVMDSGAEVPVSSLDWLVSWEFDDEPPNNPYVKAVDVLIEAPPLLPEKTDWQQITRRGDRTHPGDDMRNWRFDDPWN